MNVPTDIQMIKGADGKPAFAVLPYAQFLALCGQERKLIPNEVVGATVEGATPARAWREYLGLTQTEVAARMGVAQPTYAKHEKSLSPRPATLVRIASALGITLEQLDF
ncbi:helix-turn-helix domain-containing protein [Herbaspirillum huttiense]|uniref:Helix-turn-helix transcriptional regulator n=1 Tax=Herbaspirillum huttiense subsp. lycopersici TaxID=3074428 RepID=A0ABU2EHT3_9BURK|nr:MULTISPECIES: helix-turn-helix transcriptional regulator [Herbaspirillum]MBN9356915.1 helix-turn-helix transcriptional regulator [Herbaspirillum huttiense]MBP1313565.1 DNA-binding XRE family transcriptional regulator [Herbaspirillum sp. 1130]MDR9847690.1 helix-turn-helix transcriptional regulator [Herbaspirillum huttiense SE1]